MYRLLVPALLLLSACTATPPLQGWQAHPDDAAWLEASIDRRLDESLAGIAHLSLLLAMADADPVTVRSAADTAAGAAAAFRAIAAAGVATAGPDAGRATLFAATAALCHDRLTHAATRIEIQADSATDALRLAQLACLSARTMRLAG